MPDYNSRIRREQGGSVQTIASGGSVNYESGAHLTGSGKIHSAGSLLVGDSGSLIAKPDATAKSSFYTLLNMGGHQMFFAPASAGSPIFSASPGDLCWIAGSAGGLWINQSDGTTGSTWANVGDSSASTTPAGP